jgi:hypothetical protein
MNDRFPQFFDQIRRRPKFIAAARDDSTWLDRLEDLEQRLETISQRPELIELTDRLLLIVNRKNITVKARLLAVGKACADFRDHNRLWEN